MLPTGEIKRFFDQRAATWDAVCSHNPARLEAIVTLAAPAADFRVLDVACGTGVLTPTLLAREPAYLLGVDLSARMIEAAQAKYSDPRLRFVAADLFELQEDGFDTAILYSAYPHFPDKQQLAARLHRLLLPGGRVMIAHSESRRTINGCHRAPDTQSISVPLRPVREEAAVFAPFFEIDMAADTDSIYFFSGIKKQGF